jgi:putative ABC transport system permease protein
VICALDGSTIIASIIVLTALQTLIIKIASAGNVLGTESALSVLTPLDNLLLVFVIVSCLCVIFFKIMNSEYGLAMRVYGDGQIISESLGINVNQILRMGLCAGNAMAAIAGALMVQVYGHFSVGIGGGSFVFGLAAVILGEKIASPRTLKGAIFGCLIGALIPNPIIKYPNNYYCKFERLWSQG